MFPTALGLCILIFRCQESAGAIPLPSLLEQLPADGVSARYRLSIDSEMHTNTAGAASMHLLVDGALTISSKGRERIEGDICRWIELKLDVHQHVLNIRSPFPINERHMKLRLLIPERYFQRGEDPLAHVQRAQFQDTDGLENLTDSVRRQYEIDRFRTYFPAELTDAKLLPDRTLQTRQGSYQCRGIEGHTSYRGPLKNGSGTSTWTGTSTFWLSDRAPFGSVAYEVTVDAEEGTNVKSIIKGRHRLLLETVTSFKTAPFRDR